MRLGKSDSMNGAKLRRYVAAGVLIVPGVYFLCSIIVDFAASR
ncbi:hypothetical protein [Dongia sp.]